MPASEVKRRSFLAGAAVLGVYGWVQSKGGPAAIAKAPARPSHPAAGHPAAGRDDAAARVVATAITYATGRIGRPYVWGGTGPDGYDCSGLVMMAYRSAGITIPRTTFEQWPALPHIHASQLRPGDLIYYAGSDGTVASPGHVVMYIGNRKVVQAYATGYPVMITPLAHVDAGPLTGYARPRT